LDKTLKKTPLFSLHRELGAKMVGFAGYDMPIQYAGGVMREHLHTRREKAGLFDVSHMGQMRIRGKDAGAFLETMTPVAATTMAEGVCKYTFLLNRAGGTIDDLIVTRMGLEDYLVVVNGACKYGDLAHMADHLPDGVSLTMPEDRALIAVQGPAAQSVLEGVGLKITDMAFMTAATIIHDYETVIVSRTGYTGEDGFEVSLPAHAAELFARRLLVDERLKPIGLGARDSLRLEAGLCLYGQDLTADISPVEAGLAWAIGKRRRQDGGFIGSDRTQELITNGPARLRTGLVPEGRAPVRAGTKLFSEYGAEIGFVSSGGYGPTVEGPVAFAYLPANMIAPGTAVLAEVRGKQLACRTAALPFVQHQYRK
jgi:aminomethyltransferase